MNQDHFNALAVGHELNEYTIKAVLGHGGFGITYLAYDKNLDKDVAIKEYLPAEFAVRQNEVTVRPRSSADEDDYSWGLERFMKEAQTLAVFQHPSIVPVYRFFEANGTAYMVMEYQRGDSLAALMRAHGGEFNQQDLMDLVGPLLDGLEEVHRAGYLHRDVKPGNIFIRENGSPVLLDFGAARHAIGSKSKSLTSIVTPGYAPLEQYFADGNQGPWTDIYALGAILYQAVKGDAPPEAPARVKKDPIVPAVDSGKGRFDEHFLQAIDFALEVEEEHRPQTVAEWRSALSGTPRAEVAAAAAGAPASGETILAGTRPGATRAPAATARASAGPQGRPATGKAERRGRAGKLLAIAASGVFLIALAAAGAWIVFGDSLQRQVADRSGQQTESEGGEQVTEVEGRVRNGEGATDGNNAATDGSNRDQASEPKIGDTERERREEEARRQAEEERIRREGEARRQAEDQRRQDEEEARRQAEEARARRQAEEEARAQRDADEEARAQRETEEEARRQQEAETRRQEEAAARQREEERQREEAERRRQEEEARRRQEASRPQRGGCAYSVSSLSGYYDPIDCVLYRRTLFSALRSSPTGTTSDWRNPRNGARGTVTIVRSYRNSNGQLCKRFMQTITAQGSTRRAHGTACIAGGNWQISG